MCELRCRVSPIWAGTETGGVRRLIFFFFFQAEDGIRDYKVTGVQTCALPIWLHRPLISQVAELSREDGKVHGKRQTEYGYDVLEAPLPAVIAVSDAINEPRYPSLKGIMGAKKKPQETLSLGDLGVDAGDAGEAGSRTEGYSLGDPPARGGPGQ